MLERKKGEILTEEREIMTRWKEYFQELLHATEESTEAEETEENLLYDDSNEEVELKEVEEAIRWLKNGKTPGFDKITSEMLKTMGNKATETLLEIYRKAWKEEKIPED